MKHTIALLAPYFHLRKENLKNQALAASLLVVNVGARLATNAMSFCVYGLLSTIATQGVSMSLALRYSYLLARSTVVIGIATMVNNWVTSKLKQNLTIKLLERFVNPWLEKSKSEPKDFATNHLDAAAVAEQSVDLADFFLKNVINFISASYFLWQASAPIKLALLGTSLTIPGYLLLFTIGYSIIYSNIISSLNDRMYSAMRTASNTLHSVTSAYAAGVKPTLESLKQTVIKYKTALANSSFYAGLIKAAQTMHFSTNFAVGIFISMPSIYAGRISEDDMFLVGGQFTDIVNCFSWQANMAKDINEIEICAERLAQSEAKFNTQYGLGK